jgi:hypothetical protein
MAEKQPKATPVMVPMALATGEKPGRQAQQVKGVEPAKPSNR